MEPSLIICEKKIEISIRRNVILLLLYFIQPLISEAQATFQKTYGWNTAYACIVAPTADDGFILAGSLPTDKIYIVKTNSNGDTSWTRSISGTTFTLPYALDVQQSADGGYVVAGTNSNSTDYDVYLLKVDSIGDLLWFKNYGGANSDFGSSFENTSDGGYILSGDSWSFGTGAGDAFLIKTDINVDTLWTKSYGGTGTDYALSVIQTADNGYAILGSTNSFGAGFNDFYLIKTDSIGQILWSKAYGGIKDDWGTSIQQTSDGGYILEGYTESFGIGPRNLYLLKIDAIGDTLWTKTYGGTYGYIGHSVQQTNDGGFILSGYLSTTSVPDNIAYIIKTDVLGDTIWTKALGTVYATSNSYNSGARSAYQTDDGGYIVSGGIESPNSGLFSFFLVKTDSTGSSGCFESSSSITITSTSTLISNPATITSGTNFNITTPVTLVDRGGTVYTLCDNIGIEEANDLFRELSIYPNPATEVISIEGLLSIGRKEIKLYNSIGQAILSTASLSETINLNVQGLSKGIYFITINDGANHYCRKIIIN